MANQFPGLRPEQSGQLEFEYHSHHHRFRFYVRVSKHLSESIDLATDPLSTPTRTISWLITLGQFLFPIWREMDHIVFGYSLIRLLIQLFPSDLPTGPYLPLDWSDYGALYFVFTAFFVYAAMWILYAMITTLWQDIFWPAFRFISTHAVLRGLAQLIMSQGYSAGFPSIKIPNLYIAQLSADVFGWPIDYFTTIRCHLVSSAEIRLQEYAEWIYAFFSLPKNVYLLLCMIL
ncbi:hypothetical protein F5Y12DRAFT_731454 [Xylaria sp. FL1777]|nr:hypothetical protein F5Y12DRAFT_731454 [Xylaria sp. FL1777]